MASYLSDNSLDALLTDVKDSTVLYICSALPSTYAQASSTYALGSKSSPTLGAIGDGDVSGRKFTVSAITDGTVSATGTASHWALVDAPGTELKAAAPLGSSQGVTNGNTFTLTSFDIEVPDPA